MKYRKKFHKKRKPREKQMMGLSVPVYNNNVDIALRKLKKKIKNSDMMLELKKRAYYEKPSKIKREKKNGVTVFHLKKDMSDAEIAKKKATFCKRPKLIINYDADVYGEEGKLLLRFRTNVLDKKKINACYDNVIKFAKNISKTRGTSSGNKGLHEKDKTKKVGVQTNILGAYDKWSIKNKHIFKKKRS